MGCGLYCWVYHVKEASLTPRWWAQGCGSPGPSSWKKHHLTASSGQARPRHAKPEVLIYPDQQIGSISTLQDKRKNPAGSIALPFRNPRSIVYMLFLPSRVLGLRCSTEGLIYWWFPDTMFTLDNPSAVIFPAYSPSEQSQNIYRTMSLRRCGWGCRAGVQVCLQGRTDVWMPNCPLLHNFGSIPIFY